MYNPELFVPSVLFGWLFLLLGGLLSLFHRIDKSITYPVRKGPLELFVSTAPGIIGFVTCLLIVLQIQAAMLMPAAKHIDVNFLLGVILLNVNSVMFFFTWGIILEQVIWAKDVDRINQFVSILISKRYGYIESPQEQRWMGAALKQLQADMKHPIRSFLPKFINVFG